MQVNVSFNGYNVYKQHQPMREGSQSSQLLVAWEIQIMYIYKTIL